MFKKLANKKNMCAACGGVLQKQKVKYDQHWGEDLVLFENVPAEVCSACGEVWLDAKTVSRIDKTLLKKVQPTRKIEIPVWSLDSLQMA